MQPGAVGTGHGWAKNKLRDQLAPIPESPGHYRSPFVFVNRKIEVS